MTEAESNTKIKLTNDTPYLVLTGELWGVYCESLEENGQRYNGTALYEITFAYPKNLTPHNHFLPSVQSGTNVTAESVGKERQLASLFPCSWSELTIYWRTTIWNIFIVYVYQEVVLFQKPALQ